jgi:hypothetical protein
MIIIMQPDASNDFLVTVLSSSNYKEIQTNVFSIIL